ncbi:hypothetical protein AUC70_01525 [Methyloceanibacter stevinii]|uniref:Pyridoxamine 5'-phosphate oxidase N-terminal domain-containing protein n=1 Tax=Methyloceanibacter stevinii TaxID=1774970 RepID=A0A1E3VQ02_9HYPH|nr:hypothetical protein AUC70_01525 [Methyloceanibacter stevinii]
MAGIAAEARSLVRLSTKGTLATLEAPSGAPYASLITLATEVDGSPIFLISTLARHTRNLVADPRAAILLDGTGLGGPGGGDPLQGARLTLSGRAERTDDPAARRRFLARQAQAAFYADFPDFSFWRLEIEAPISSAASAASSTYRRRTCWSRSRARRASWRLRTASSRTTRTMPPPSLSMRKSSAVWRLIRRHPLWLMSGLDPLGCDLVRGTEALRIDFRGRIHTPQDARKELVRLVDEARATLGSA